MALQILSKDNTEYDCQLRKENGLLLTYKHKGRQSNIKLQYFKSLLGGRLLT